MNKAIFIDKDGTLIHDVPYNVDPALIRFNDGAIDALQQWSGAGYLIVIISNQSGIAYNYFSEEAIEKVNQYLTAQFAFHHITLHGFYYCPHHPAGNNALYAVECNCRKPLPGLILEAAKALSVDVRQSWMIGDILNDVEAGNRAGCRSILLNNGNETEWLQGEYRVPGYTTGSLREAAHFILHHSS